MGRGDKKTKKGKISACSYGKTRSHTPRKKKIYALRTDAEKAKTLAQKAALAKCELQGTETESSPPPVVKTKKEKKVSKKVETPEQKSTETSTKTEAADGTEKQVANA